MKEETKEVHYAVRVNKSLANSIELTCKELSIEKSAFIRSALEKAIERD